MARIKNGILGNVIGSVSKVTAYRRLKTNVIQVKVDRSKVKSSSSQLYVQSGFKVLTRLMNAIYYQMLIKSFFLNPSVLSNWNQFVKDNYDLFAGGQLSGLNNMQLSSGTLESPKLINFTKNFEENTMTVTWVTPSSPFDPANLDLFNVLAYNRSTNDFVYFVNNADRRKGVFIFDIPENWEALEKVFIYLYFIERPSVLNASYTENKQLIL